jgi:hypothetical protein
MDMPTKKPKKSFPLGAKVYVNGRDLAIVKQAFPEGAEGRRWPHYKVDFVDGDKNVVVHWKNVGVKRSRSAPSGKLSLVEELKHRVVHVRKRTRNGYGDKHSLRIVLSFAKNRVQELEKSESEFHAFLAEDADEGIAELLAELGALREQVAVADELLRKLESHPLARAPSSLGSVRSNSGASQ